MSTATRVVGSLLLATSVAGAAPPAPEKREPYRSALMFGDSVSMAFTLGFGALAYRSRNCDCEDFSGQGVFLGLGMYLAFGAVAHAEAEHVGRAVASVAMRAALPIAAGEGAHLAGASTRWSVAAAGAGMLAAMGIDWFVLADATHPAKVKTAVYVTPTGGGVVAGIGGVLP